jgi:hypothetical protein
VSPLQDYGLASQLFEAASGKAMRGQGNENVTKFVLICADFAPHIVCPPKASAITCYALEFTGC